jgi:hypothetical protein
LNEKTDYEDDDSHRREDECKEPECARRLAAGTGEDLLPRRNVHVVIGHRPAPPVGVCAGALSGVARRVVSTPVKGAAAVSVGAAAPPCVPEPRGAVKGAGCVGPIRDGPGNLSPVTPGAARGPIPTVAPPAPCRPRM